MHMAISPRSELTTRFTTTSFMALVMRMSGTNSLSSWTASNHSSLRKRGI
jgi:hypothetical protein